VLLSMVPMQCWPARQEKTTRDTLPHDLDSRKLFDFVFCRAGHIFFSAKEFILSF